MTTQCTEVTSGQTQEEPGPEATHSAQSILLSPTPAANSSHATLKVSKRGKLSGRAKSVRVHVGGNRFLVYSCFSNRLPSAALPSSK